MNALLTRWRRPAVLVATAATTVAAVVAVPAGTGQAQPPACIAVAYQATTWSTGPDAGGFVLNLTLTNGCDDWIDGWTLQLTLAPGHNLSHGWSAGWSQSGDVVTATDLSWNAQLSPGESTAIGFVGSFTGTFQDPLSCTINGADCGGEPGGDQPPEVSLTRPTPNGGYVSGCPARLAAEAASPTGAIDRVEFFVNGELVGTAHAAPYQAEVPFDHPALDTGGTNVAMARAFDDSTPAGSADSEPVSFFFPIPPPALMFIACVEEPLELVEGTSQVIQYLNYCGEVLEAEVTVTGDTGITASPESFTFPPGGQVTVSAAAGAAGATATLTVAAGICSVTRSVTVLSQP